MNKVNFDPKLDRLEQKIGYTFKNINHLKEAMTHSSYANELRQKNVRIQSNERLEFLGDAVLEIISSTYLFEKYPSVPEGELTRLRSESICTAALSGYARELDLGSHIYFGKGERKTDGKNKASTLENAFEALLGAIYLDSGHDLEKVSTFLLKFLAPRIESMQSESTDYKSELQQIIQQTPGEELTYEELSKTGPDNAPTFRVVAKLNSNIIGRGVGHSKKKAEQNAARDAIETFFKNR